MNKIINYISVFAALFVMASCGQTLEQINVDVNNPTSVDLKLMLPEVESQTAFNEGTNSNRVAGIWMQQFFGLDAQQLAYNSYIAGPDVMNNYWGAGLYTGVLRSCDVMIKNSAERPFYGAVGKIIMANELGKATSVFGDLPYTEAFLGTDNLQPAYDSQESIYGVIQSLLSEAIATLSVGDGGGYNGGDLIYGGSEASWVAAAHAFKARYYLQTSKRNSGNYASALTELASAFTSNADAPSFTFDISETANWALAKFGIERPSTLGIDARFADMMEGDPRKDLYMDDGLFFFDGAEGNLVWGRSAASIPLISYVEVKFIEAEATAATGGDGTAALAEAIQASMDLVGATDDGYVAANSADGSIENIITEAYKAYYGFNFHETWSNWRRTGFPALTPTADASNGFNPSGSVPQRYLYAESEVQTNNTNVEAAKAAQGGALLDATLWVFE